MPRGGSAVAGCLFDRVGPRGPNTARESGNFTPFRPSVFSKFLSGAFRARGRARIGRFHTFSAKFSSKFWSGTSVGHSAAPCMLPRGLLPHARYSCFSKLRRALEYRVERATSKTTHALPCVTRAVLSWAGSFYSQQKNKCFTGACGALRAVFPLAALLAAACLVAFRSVCPFWRLF